MTSIEQKLLSLAAIFGEKGDLELSEKLIKLAKKARDIRDKDKKEDTKAAFYSKAIIKDLITNLGNPMFQNEHSLTGDADHLRWPIKGNKFLDVLITGDGIFVEVNTNATNISSKEFKHTEIKKAITLALKLLK